MRSFRWGLLLRPLRRIEQKNLFPIACVGFLGILLLPARSGELIRPYLLSKKEPISMSAALATIVVERIMDVITILIFIIFISFSTELPVWVFRAGYISLGIIATILFVLFLMISKEAFLLRIGDRIFRPFSEHMNVFIQKFIISFSGGARILFHWPILVWAFSVSILLWSAMAICNYIMFFAFSFSLPLVAAFILVIVVNLGLMLPTAPGFIGSFHFFFIVGLTIFGVDREQALSFGILSHAVQFLFVVFMGIIYFPVLKIQGVPLGKKMGTLYKD
jgi:uncharacterized protein (TIRG00374 family)